MPTGISQSADKSQLMMESGEFNEKDVRHFRRVAFLAVALSTVTMLSCVIVMPISYQYIQRIQSSVSNDIEFCRVSFKSFKHNEYCQWILRWISFHFALKFDNSAYFIEQKSGFVESGDDRALRQRATRPC